MDILFRDPPLFIIFLYLYLGIAVFAVFLLILNTFLKMRGYPKYIRDHSQQFFPDITISSKGFYTEVEEKIKALGLPDLKYETLSFLQKDIFTGSRLYFRVKRNDTMFDICAAPYGNNFFVSWWLGQKIPLATRICMYLPIIGRFLKRDWETRTYYDMDTEAMFKGAIKHALAETIEEMNTPTGIARMKISEAAGLMIDKKPGKEEGKTDNMIGDELKRDDVTV